MAVDLERWQAFNHFGEEAKRILAGAAELRQFVKGDPIAHEGTPVTHLGVILIGVAEVVGSGPDGREAVIEILREQDGFGVADAVQGAGHLASVRALRPSEVVLIGTDALLAAQASDPSVGRVMMGLLAERTHSLVRQVKDLKLRTGVQRLGCFLLRVVDESGTGTGWARIPLPKAVLASRLGMTPETLSRALNQLRDLGMEIRGSRVQVRDRAPIEQLCLPHPSIDGHPRVASAA